MTRGTPAQAERWRRHGRSVHRRRALRRGRIDVVRPFRLKREVIVSGWLHVFKDDIVYISHRCFRRERRIRATSSSRAMATASERRAVSRTTTSGSCSLTGRDRRREPADLADVDPERRIWPGFLYPRCRITSRAVAISRYNTGKRECGVYGVAHSGT